jgi:nucleoside-diphosphate-sugar epimerase
MKILITGGAGYIGSVLCEELLNIGHEVVCLDNLFFQQTPNANLFHNKNYTFIREDVQNISTVNSIASSCDVIIPLAALVGAPICSRYPSLAKETNLNSIKKLIDSLSKDQLVIMPITNSGYGIGNANEVCTEDSPLNPISNYGRDKVELEKYILDNKENFVSFRLATVFGCSPRMRIDLLVNDFVYRAKKDNFLVLFEHQFVRNYIHIRDVCNAFMYSLSNWDSFKNEIFNLGLSDANLSKLELAQRIKNQIPNLTIIKEEFTKDPDQRNYIVSNEKVEKLGFQPSFSIDRGIDELVKFYSALPRGNFSNV